MTGNTGEAREARCEVEAQEVQGGADDQVWDLGDCLSSDEGNPMVGFGLKKTRLSVLCLSPLEKENSLTFFSRVSKMSRLCKKKGCI